MLLPLSCRSFSSLAALLGAVACSSPSGKGTADASFDQDSSVTPGRDAGHDAAHDTGHDTGATADTGGPVDAGHDSSAPSPTHLTGQTITVNGTPRTYDVTIPVTCDASHLHPIVFLFHGDGGKGSELYDTDFLLEAAAAAAGDEAIFVYPNGTNNNENGSAWDIYDDPGAFPYTTPSPTGNHDVDFFDAMVAYFESSKSCADPAHVYITGFSNGGYVANQFARWRSKVVKATAPMSGGPPAGSVTPSTDYAAPNYCVGATDPVPALIIHGDSDGTVDPSLCQQAASYWDMANVCADNAADCSASSNSLLVPPATPTTATTPSPCVSSNGCKTGYPVVLCEIPGMGHQVWTEAATTVWTFFKAH